MKKSSLPLVMLLLLGSLTIHPSIASAGLESAYEAELKLATKVNFGQPIPLAIQNCKYIKVKSKVSEKCNYEKFVITVNSFKFNGIRTPIGVGVSSYAIDIKMENFTSQETGLDVGEFLKCKSSRSGSSFYADGMDPQYIPAKSQEGGIVISSFPDEVAIDKCELPVLWISLSSYSVNIKDKKMMKELKKNKLVGAAYIPLTPQMLAGS